MADKVNVAKGQYLDPRVENEDGSFGAYRTGYMDPDTHRIVFDGEEAAELEQAEPVEELETAEVEADVPQDLDAEETPRSKHVPVSQIARDAIDGRLWQSRNVASFELTKYFVTAER